MDLPPLTVTSLKKITLKFNWMKKLSFESSGFPLAKLWHFCPYYVSMHVFEYWYKPWHLLVSTSKICCSRLKMLNMFKHISILYYIILYYIILYYIILYYIILYYIISLHYANSSLTWVFSTSFSVPCALLSVLGSPVGTGQFHRDLQALMTVRMPPKNLC